MNTIIIFATLQNNLCLVYIFGFFSDWWFGLLWSSDFTIFKVGYQNNCYQILKQKIHEKIRQGGKACQF